MATRRHDIAMGADYTKCEPSPTGRSCTSVSTSQHLAIGIGARAKSLGAALGRNGEGSTRRESTRSTRQPRPTRHPAYGTFTAIHSDRGIHGD